MDAESLDVGSDLAPPIALVSVESYSKVTTVTTRQRLRPCCVKMVTASSRTIKSRVDLNCRN